MTTLEELITELQGALTLVAAPLYEGLAHSVAEANKDLQRYDHTKYPHMRSLHVRAAMREFAEVPGVLPSGWAPGGRSTQMGQLSFENDDLGYTAQFLKENGRLHPGGIPPAGHSESQKKRWAQGTLVDIAAVERERPRKIHLVHAWDFGRFEDGQIDVNAFRSRIVHTTAAGVFGKAVPLDFFFDLLPGGHLHARSRFDGDASEEEFFFSAQEESGDQ